MIFKMKISSLFLLLLFCSCLYKPPANKKIKRIVWFHHGIYSPDQVTNKCIEDYDTAGLIRKAVCTYDGGSDTTIFIYNTMHENILRLFSTENGRWEKTINTYNSKHELVKSVFKSSLLDSSMDVINCYSYNDKGQKTLYRWVIICICVTTYKNKFFC